MAGPVSQKKQPRKDKANQPPRAGRMQPIGAALPKIASKAIGKRGFAEASLITDWKSIVGDTLAEVSQPTKLSFRPGERTDGTLHINVQGGVATELQHLEPLVIERINSHFGYGAVSRLRLVHAPAPARAKRKQIIPARPLDRDQQQHLEQLLRDVEDDDIRAALSRLGNAIMTQDDTVKKS